jgi:hypothetical protein
MSPGMLVGPALLCRDSLNMKSLAAAAWWGASRPAGRWGKIPYVDGLDAAGSDTLIPPPLVLRGGGQLFAGETHTLAVSIKEET